MSEQKESNITQCKVCGQLKPKIVQGKYEGKKDKIYVDENGIRWNGKSCGLCHRERVKIDQRNKKNAAKN